MTISSNLFSINFSFMLTDRTSFLRTFVGGAHEENTI